LAYIEPEAATATPPTEIPKLSLGNRTAAGVVGTAAGVVAGGSKILKKFWGSGSDRSGSDRSGAGSDRAHPESPPNSTNGKAWFGVSLQVTIFELCRKRLIQ